MKGLAVNIYLRRIGILSLDGVADFADNKRCSLQTSGCALHGGHLRVGNMGQGRFYRSICFHILLVATAIQGGTPDPHDLASIKPLWLLCGVLGDPETLSDNDGLPDEVCEPMSAQPSVMARQRAEPAPAMIRDCPAKFVLSSFRSGADGLLAAHDNTRHREQMIYMLCRLVC
jgi:hypothetical protein